MKQKHRLKQKSRRVIAKEHIANLFTESDIERSMTDRYLHVAKKIAMKMKIKFTKAQNMRICGNCDNFLIPGYNARVRIRKKTISYFCNRCNSFTRYGKKKVIK